LIVIVYNKLFCFKTMQRIKCLKMRQGLKIIALISSKTRKPQGFKYKARVGKAVLVSTPITRQHDV